jgi:hypothetical protein
MPTTITTITAAKLMEWFLINDCMVVSRKRFESGEPYDMMREFILYVSGSANQLIPDTVSTQPDTPKKTERTKPTEVAPETATEEVTDNQCMVVRKNGSRCMRIRNDNGCPEFCGTHSAMLAKSNLSKEEFLEKCMNTKVVAKRTKPTSDTKSAKKPVVIAKPAQPAVIQPTIAPTRSTITYKGIPYVVDSSGKVFDHSDILEEKESPRVIGMFVKESGEVVLTEGRISPSAGV